MSLATFALVISFLALITVTFFAKLLINDLDKQVQELDEELFAANLKAQYFSDCRDELAAKLSKTKDMLEDAYVDINAMNHPKYPLSLDDDSCKSSAQLAAEMDELFMQ